MVCLESDYERSYSKLPETGPNSKMTKSLVVEVVRMTTDLLPIGMCDLIHMGQKPHNL